MTACLKIEKYNACACADDHADAHSKILRYIVGIEHAESSDNSTKSLDKDGNNHHPIVDCKKAILRNRFPVEEKYANEEGWE